MHKRISAPIYGCCFKRLFFVYYVSIFDCVKAKQKPINPFEGLMGFVF